MCSAPKSLKTPAEYSHWRNVGAVILDLVLETFHCSQGKTSRIKFWLALGTFLCMSCIWGHYQAAEAFLMSTTPIALTKNTSGVPIDYIDSAFAWPQLTVLGWLIPQRWPSFPTSPVPISSYSQEHVDVFEAEKWQLSPWRDLVLSIPPLVPEKGFKVFWLPL